MVSQKDEHRRLFTTEEVLSFLRADSERDETSSEGSDDDWETDESGTSDVPIVKRAKLTTSTMQLQEQQLNQPTNLPGASRNFDNHTNSALESISEGIDLSSEESSLTSDDLSSCDDEMDADGGDWVDSSMDCSTTMPDRGDDGENWQLEDVEHILVENDGEHTHMENDGEHRQVEANGEHRQVNDDMVGDTLVDNGDGINSGSSSQGGHENSHSDGGNSRGGQGSSHGGVGGDSSSPGSHDVVGGDSRWWW